MGQGEGKHTHTQLEDEDNEFVWLKQDLQAKQTHANATHSDTYYLFFSLALHLSVLPRQTHKRS